MAKQSGSNAAQPSIVTRVQTFFQEVKTEMGKVTWPSVEELKASTQVVLMLLALLAGIVYVFDQVFQLAVLWMLKLA